VQPSGRIRGGGAIAAVCAALAVAGCGGSGPAVPRGNPDSRHGATAVDAYAQVELLRALLLASSDGYYAGGSADDARAQLRRARQAYAALQPRVTAKDPVVDREVVARFDVTARELRQGALPDHYRDLAGPLADQLMDGVAQALVSPGARADAGVQAEALRRVTLRLSATYDAASASAGDTDARLAFQEAWGLWRRAQALDAVLGPDLGSQKTKIATTLANLRGSAFPDGPSQPDEAPATAVDAATTKIVRALDRRFGLAAV
jgi:hypothetical protein